jgi:hypothetical protein
VNSQFALARLKVRVNPVVPPAFQDIARRSQLNVRVKARIDEKGELFVLSTEGESPMMNSNPDGHPTMEVLAHRRSDRAALRGDGNPDRDQALAADDILAECYDDTF